MRGGFRELIAWELEDNWAFPILELVIAIAIIQVMPIVSLTRGYYDVVRPFFEAMLFVLVISTAIVFGRSFGESIEKRKLIVLLSYPVSRTRVFVAKYLANLLTVFLIFGAVLFAQGVSLFMFDGRIPLVAWFFMFLYLFLAVFFTGSLMTFIAIAIRRFGLSVLIFLIYVFGMEYWLSPPRTLIKNPLAYLSLDRGPYSSVVYSYTWYYNTLNIGIARSGVTQTFFLTTLGYMLGGGLIILLASLFLMNKIDLD